MDIVSIKKVGNSKGIVLNSALLKKYDLSEGDKFMITKDNNGALILVPVIGDIYDRPDLPDGAYYAPMELDDKPQGKELI